MACRRRPRCIREAPRPCGRTNFAASLCLRRGSSETLTPARWGSSGARLYPGMLLLPLRAPLVPPRLPLAPLVTQPPLLPLPLLLPSQHLVPPPSLLLLLLPPPPP